KVLDFGIFDAMGHGLEASRIANLVIGGYRWARRRHDDLPATYRAIDDAIASQFGGERFSTGLLATLDVETGRLSWVTAGHPRPLLLRGGRVSGELQAGASLPLGLGDPDPIVQDVS